MDSGPNNGQPQQPLFCLKLQLTWGNTTDTTARNTRSSSSSCNLEEPPWMFKSMQGITKNLSPEDKSPGGGNEDMFRGPKGWGELEQRALAAALACRKDATVLEFYLPSAGCAVSLVKFVEEVQRRNADWVNIVMADAENETWFPELLHYDIKYVPCFMLLDKNGKALAMTGVPSSHLHMIAGLSHLLKMKRPQS